MRGFTSWTGPRLSVKPHNMAVVPSFCRVEADFLMGIVGRVVHKPRTGPRSFDPWPGLLWGWDYPKHKGHLCTPSKGPWRRALAVRVKGTGLRCGFKSRLCHFLDV